MQGIMDGGPKNPVTPAVIKIIAIYALVSGLWIYLSDTVVGLIISDPATVIRISVYKGFLFVAITSALLYHLVSRHFLESNLLKETIKNKELLFILLSEGMIDAYVCVDMTGKILQFNEVYRAMLGYEAEELLSKTYLELTPEKWHVMERNIINRQVIPRGYSEIYEKEYYRKDGTIFPVELRIQLIRDDQGNPSVMWAIIRDITERKQVEEALAHNSQQLKELNQALEIRVEKKILELRQRDQVLLQQNRLATMGDMIHNISHQWRQPLNALGLTIQLLPLEFEKGNFDKEFLDKSVQEAMLLIDYMSNTIDDFRYFFKPDKEKEEFNVSQSVARAIQIIKASYDFYNIKIVTNYLDEPVIQGYPNEYAQVVLNILGNAKDALLEGNVANPQVIVTTSVEEGRSVVYVSDNAGGIPDEIIYKVFDPLFSTKGPQGTGIGLFMSKNIIERNMNGRLTVRNSAQGAEFRIEV
ncbi:MAG: PAS domain S-box protein [Desulfobacteraceae bacterium]|nr:PAS domain S-box protein [Desulfobacteraceae bacterium]